MADYETFQHDVLVIGAGGAGLRAAIGKCISPIPCAVASTSINGAWPSCTQKRLPIGCANWKLGVQSSIEQKMVGFCSGTLVVINIRDSRTSAIGPVWR